MKKNDRKYAIGFIIIGVLLLFCAYKFIQIKDINEEEIILFGAKTSKKIELISSRRSNSLLIKVSKYPEFDFRISGVSLNEFDSDDLIKNVKKGDSIFIGVYKTDYAKKILKTDSLSTIDRFFNYKIIPVEIVKTEKFKYLDLHKVNEGRNKNKSWGVIFFGLFGSFLLFRGLMMLKINKET